jgi:hypothetical protein
MAKRDGNEFTRHTKYHLARSVNYMCSKCGCRGLQAARDHWRGRLEDPVVEAERVRTFRSIVDFLDSELRVLDDVQRRGAFRQ